MYPPPHKYGASGRIILASELDARFEALEQLVRRNRSLPETRRPAPIPIDVPIPIEVECEMEIPAASDGPDDEQQGVVEFEAGEFEAVPVVVVLALEAVLVVAGLTSVLYVGIVSAHPTPA